tara:strand:+ start:295 stop:1371 length:1077 start_codon:yes stop_codon:yes gene_type:complete
LSEKIKIGLIGCGRIAGHHFKAVSKNKNFQIVSVCDLNFNKANYYAKKFKVTPYDHFSKMLDNEKSLDLVAVMTPSGMHYEHSLKILKKYNVNIIVEKPTFLKTTQVKKIYEIAKGKKIKIYPVFQNRYNKAIKRVKKALVNNELGKINIINVRVRWCRPQRYYDLSDWRGTYSHDGGALTNQGIHHIDLLRYLFGEVKTVNCKMKTFGAKIEVEDSAVANLEFQNNSIGTLEITTAARPKDYEASISIIGSKGLAQVGGWAVNELQIFSIKNEDCYNFSQKIPDAYGFGHYDFYNDIAKDFKQNIKFPIGYKDCYKTIQLLNSFYVSNEKKKTVIVNKILDSKKLGRVNNKISNVYK